MEDIAISIENVKKSFGSRRKKLEILHNISLTIERGAVFGFIGPNGAGKTTTIKLLLNFTKPDSGTIRVGGKTVGHEEFRTQVGYLPESPCFYEHLTAFETLSLAGRLTGMDGNKIKEGITHFLGRMKLENAANVHIRNFSKGMKQRLGMAAALIHDPDILIFDEPMSGLDPLGRYMIRELFEELREQGKTIFFSSHILSDIGDLSDSLGIIHKGNILFSGSVVEFTGGSKNIETQFISAIQEVDREIA